MTSDVLFAPELTGRHLQISTLDRTIEPGESLPTDHRLVFVNEGERLVAFGVSGVAATPLGAESTVNAIAFVLGVAIEPSVRKKLVTTIKDAIRMNADLLDMLSSEHMRSLLHTVISKSPSQGGIVCSASLAALTRLAPVTQPVTGQTTAHPIPIVPSQLRITR